MTEAIETKTTTKSFFKKQTRKFWIKAGAFVLGLSFCATLYPNYIIGFDDQEVRCLPDHSWYVIDKTNRKIERNGIYAFKARGMEPLVKDGTIVVKLLKAMPGDQVEINAQQQVIINETVVTQGLSKAEQLGLPATNFMGKGVLQGGQYWFLGEADESFDSRYWGVVTDEQIIGRAHPIL